MMLRAIFYLLISTLLETVYSQNSSASSDKFNSSNNVLLPLKRVAELTIRNKFERYNHEEGAKEDDTTHETVSTPKHEEDKDPEKELIEFLNSMKSFIRDITDKAMRHLLPVVMSLGSEVKLSKSCMFAFLQLVKGLREFQPWTMKLLDASSKIPEGVLYGSMSTFGSYDECLSVVANEKDPKSLRGQFCSVNISPDLPPKPRRYSFDTAFKKYPKLMKTLKDMHLSDLMPSFYFIAHRFGFCLPSSCSRDDVSQMAQFATRYVKLNVTVIHCETKQELSLTKGQIIASTLIVGVITVIVLLTLMDVTPKIRRSIMKTKRGYDNKESKKGKWHELIEACSGYRNARIILSTDSQTGSLRALHGIRFLSCTWVILGHTYYCKNYVQVAALTKVKELGSGLLFQVVLNAAFAADTFFFLSGLLVVYVTMQKLKEMDGEFNIFLFYLRRYWRLTPAFMLASSLILLGPICGSGPIWQETLRPFVSGCETNWWANLLYVSNLIRTSESCVPHGWYISCDMQFYLVSPVIFLALYRRPGLGKLLLVSGVVLSIATVATLTLFYEQPPVSLFSMPDPSDVEDFLDTIGYKPYTHFAPYCIGMATGYLLSKNSKLSIRAMWQALGWFMAVLVSLTVVYGTLSWNSGYMPSLPIKLIYAAVCRPLWTLCIAWVTVACVTGHGGIINTVLSWKGFVPLSRLTYLAYLLHPLMMYIYVSYARSPIYFSQYIVVYMFLGHLCVSFALAFAFSLAFESPFLSLDKLLSQRIASKRRRREDDPAELKDAVVIKSIHRL